MAETYGQEDAPIKKCFTVDSSGSVLLRIKVEPRSSRPGIAGIHGDAVKVRLSSPPVEGRANAELLSLLAKALKLKKSQVELISGRSSKQKKVRFTGIKPEALEKLI